MASKNDQSTITIIRESIFNFLDIMKRDRRRVEQEILDRTDAILNNFVSSGITQISFNDIQQLNQRYRNEFIDYYKNTIHLVIIANASKQIRDTLEAGFNDPELLHDELLKSINALRSEVEQIPELKTKINDYEVQINEQSSIISDLSDDSQINSTDAQAYQKAISERDDMIRKRDELLGEKDQEIINLTEGLNQMESQTDNLGQSILEKSINIEELQEAISDKDDNISKLQSEIDKISSSSQEISDLQKHLTEAQDTIRSMEGQLSTSSGEILDKVKSDLDDARNQLLDMQKENVSKDDDLHKLKLEHEKARGEFNKINDENQNLKTTHEQAKISETELKQQILYIQQELDKKTHKVNNLETKIEEITGITAEDSGTVIGEGMVAIASEEKLKMEMEINELTKMLDENQKALDFIQEIVTLDVKIQVLMYISSIDEEIRLADLAKALNEERSIILRIVIELENRDMVTSRKEGRYVFVKKRKELVSPFVLEPIQ